MLVRIKVYLAAFIGYLLGRWRMGKAALRLARLLARKKLSSMPARRWAASNQRKLQLQRVGLTAVGAMAGAGAAYAAYRMTRSVAPETSEAEQPAGEGPSVQGAVSLGESTDETGVPPEGAIRAAREAPKAKPRKAAKKGAQH